MHASNPNPRFYNPDWWRGAVIYQVYPRSFLDTNGDGVGDLPGVIARLDYLARLHVDALWLSPFFTSPMKDFGYDVSNYRDVDPLFGTLADFDRLVTEAHARGLRLIIDHVPSHTSDQHPWFLESRSGRDNPRHDWYVWADPKPDGTPPNNWLSVFGGPAWTWDSRRRQYYLHHFLSAQPALNYHNPAVQDQLLADLEFWLQRGVDGFRLDAVNFCFHDAQRRDNPPRIEALDRPIGVRPDNPYAWQRHLYDKTQPEMPSLLRRIRALLDRYPGTTTLGEIGDDQALETLAAYTAGGDKLHMAYTFDLLTEAHSPAFIRETVTRVEAGLHEGWPCWAIGNHDVPRVASRWGDGRHNRELARAHAVMLLTLRGSACLYQGDELGLEEVALALEDRVDPYGRAFWPDYPGRDGCRTPMPWTSDPLGGFTTGRPWLPLGAKHRQQNVSEQEQHPDSLLQALREFLAWRAQHPALRLGALRFQSSPADMLAYARIDPQEHLLVLINLSAAVQEWTPRFEPGYRPEPIGMDLKVSGAQWHGSGVRLNPFCAAFARIQPF